MVKLQNNSVKVLQNGEKNTPMTNLKTEALKTRVLQSTVTLYRDCWKKDNGWLTIRQITFNPDGTEPVCKIINLDPKQQEDLSDFLAAKGVTD